MPQEAEAGRRLARDMRRIREARNLTMGDLHDETKIPLTLIEAFEDTGLFDHPQFNRVYLRSFVRTYAHVVGLDADLALEALEEALAGRYEGALATEYLGESPATAEPSLADDNADDVSDASAEPGASARDPRARRRSEEQETETEERYPPFVSTTSDVAAGYEDEPVEEEWASTSPPSARRDAAGAAVPRTPSRSPSRRGRREQATASRGWIIGGAIILIVAVVVWILVTVIGSEEPRTSPPVATADTMQTADTSATSRRAAPAVTLPAIGDTLDVQIIAANGKVDPIRVTVDDDLRRPYWLEQGDSMAFYPLNRIVVEELLDSIDLKVEGIAYPTDRRDEQGRIVITRDSLENYFASLRGGQ